MHDTAVDDRERDCELPSAIAVVVPPRNEAATIGRALNAILESFDHPTLRTLRTELIVVDDGSSDATGAIARDVAGSVASVITVNFGSVGSARRAGFDVVLDRTADLDDDRIWIATTDADSVVPRHWLRSQIAWWRRGADAVAGTVVPLSWDERPVALASIYDAMIRRLGTGHGHPHVHGANLAFTARAYRAAGGMPNLSSGEDHAIWRALGKAGMTRRSVGDIPVGTSTRTVARAPRGFAALLTSLQQTPPITPAVKPAQ